MFALLFDGSSGSKQLIFVERVRSNDTRKARLAFGKRSGFVHY